MDQYKYNRSVYRLFLCSHSFPMAKFFYFYSYKIMSYNKSHFELISILKMIFFQNIFYCSKWNCVLRNKTILNALLNLKKKKASIAAYIYASHIKFYKNNKKLLILNKKINFKKIYSMTVDNITIFRSMIPKCNYFGHWLLL